MAAAPSVMVCPPERHVAVPSHELLAGLTELLPAAQQLKFGDLWRIMTELTRHDSAEFRRSLMKNFGVFSAATSGRPLHLRRGAVPPSERELDAMEQAFLGELVALMQAGHYRLLDAQMWDIAQAEAFMFTLPVTVKWSNVDGDLLSKFWAQRPDMRQQLPDISDHILIFHRGLDVVKLRGFFFAEKVDMLMGMAVREPLAALTAALTGRRSGASAGTPASAESAIGEGNHRAAKTVERKTLRRLFPTLRSLVAGLGKEVELVEPCFKDVVIVYRDKAPASSKPPAEQPGAAAGGTPPKAQRNLHIKRFQDIPMADVEMVFPDKEVSVNNMTLISLIVTVVAAVAAGAAALMAANADGKIAWREVSTVMSVVGMMLGRCVQVFLQMRANKRWIDDQMQRALYAKSVDSQEGLLLALLDETEEQLNKQALLAYFVLLRQYQQLADAASLDARVEALLEEHFGCPVDFDVEVALKKIIRDSIATVSQNRISALSLDAALQKMDERWDSLFHFVLSGGEAQLPAGSDVSLRGTRQMFSEALQGALAAGNPHRLSITSLHFGSPVTWTEDMASSHGSRSPHSHRHSISSMSGPTPRQSYNGGGTVNSRSDAASLGRISVQSIGQQQPPAKKKGKKRLAIFKRVFNSPFS